VVGADLAEQFPDAREVQPFHVSLVAEDDVWSEDPPERTTFARRILTVGRLDAEKNPLLLAEAMALLAADGDARPPWRLDVYGEGPLEPELARKIAELGLQDAITLRGYVGIDAGLREAYERADLFLHVSWTEGMPQVLIEAFAARLPTVATDVGGVAALAGDAALLVAPGDAQAVADALRRLNEDEGLRTRMVEAGTVIAHAHTTEAEAGALAAFLTGVPA
jgi:glycosyltransferase involved in cell wall biosynthesis